MKRTTLSLPDDLLERLRLIAQEEQRSMATVMREALEEAAARWRPRPRSLGIGASGKRGVARRTATERSVPRTWR